MKLINDDDIVLLMSLEEFSEFLLNGQEHEDYRGGLEYLLELMIVNEELVKQDMIFELLKKMYWDVY